MTIQDILNSYDVEGGRIVSPGKFEGEPVFAPFFWDIAMQGLADSDNGTVFTFKFRFSNSEDEALSVDFPTLKKWLGNRRTLRLSENSQGFVHCF